MCLNWVSASGLRAYRLKFGRIMRSYLTVLLLNKPSILDKTLVSRREHVSRTRMERNVENIQEIPR